jgi:GMP reductase
MKISTDIKLDFSDVLLRPKRSDLGSRSEVDIEREFYFKNSKQSWRGVPIITSNMDTIGTFEMYNVLKDYKMMTCFHKYYDVTDYPDNLDPNYYMLSTGIKDHDWEKTTKLIDKLNPKFLCIDVANGYSQRFVNSVRKYREAYPNLVLAGGNVCTREIVEELSLNGGLDMIKIGIGNGSVCTTRIQTGVGYPQLSAVIECADAAHGVDTTIISDGGVVCAGDFSKAFCGGADFVMSGSMFAGHDETAGQRVLLPDGKEVKVYYGMSSDTAMNRHHGGIADYRSSEGKTVQVPYRGPVKDTVQSILGGIRSTCTYIGARKLKNMGKCATFIRVNRQVNTLFG